MTQATRRGSCAAVWGLGIYLLGQDLSRLLPWVHRLGYVEIAMAGLIVLALLTVRHFRARHRT